MVFFKKNILIPTVAEKNIQILVEEKNNNLIQSFCHNLMLNSTTKINVLTRVVRNKFFERKKNLQGGKLNGLSLKHKQHEFH